MKSFAKTFFISLVTTALPCLIWIEVLCFCK